MSTKPVTIPRWNTAGTNRTTPLSGQSDSGWTASQLANSSFDNWAKFWTYKWIQWLDDGDVTFDTIIATGLVTVEDLVINDDLTVTGLTTLEDLVVNASATFGNLTATLTATLANINNTGQNTHGVRFMSIEPRGEFVNPGVGNVGNVADVDNNELTTIGGSFRYRAHRLSPGDRVLTILVAYTGAAHPDVELHHDGFGLAPIVLACSTLVPDEVANGGIKVRLFSVDVPTALGRLVGLAPINFAQRAGIKVTATAVNTFIYGISLTYDRVTIPTVAV